MKVFAIRCYIVLNWLVTVLQGLAIAAWARLLTFLRDLGDVLREIDD